jgi:hypothetical protein
MNDQLAGVSHYPSTALFYGTRVRQRCAWCGYLIIDQDLALTEVLLNEDGSTPEFPTWPMDKWIEVTGHNPKMTSTKDEPFDEVPENGCMRIPIFEDDSAGAGLEPR